MFGKLLYRYKRRFGHGFRTAWYRDVVRYRILQTAPVVADDYSVCEIHVLTSSADWINLAWAVKSFYWASGRRYALCVHDDGTLTKEIRDTLAVHFPVARILNSVESRKAVLPDLINYPRCDEFRRTNRLSPKVIDFRKHLRSDRMLLLDSDVLFFSEPTELLRRVENPDYRQNSVNRDVKSAYTVAPEAAKQHCMVDLIGQFNSGLGIVHRESLNLDWIEEFLSIPGIVGHFWRIEQTLFALLSSRYGVELLTPEYDVFLDGRVEAQPARHYVGAIRHLMYREGIARIWKSGMLAGSHDYCINDA